MSKKECKDKEYKAPESAKYSCKKCGREAVKESKICKPKKLKKVKNA